jgi:exonuclease VII small subunit
MDGERMILSAAEEFRAALRELDESNAARDKAREQHERAEETVRKCFTRLQLAENALRVTAGGVRLHDEVNLRKAG